jgi:hypothetical protein
MKTVADQIAGEPGYGYLGHFAQRRWLELGHNDIDASGKQNSADDMNSFVEQNTAQNAPGVAGTYTPSTVTGSPL